MGITIRSEEARDIAQVRSVLRAAFPTQAESRLADALRENGKALLSLVATSGDQVLGHILCSPVSTSPSSEPRGMGLAPVAVHPDFQSCGIGSQLIHKGLHLSKELGYDYCVVLGDPTYYQRFGFEKASTFGVRNEYGVDDEFMFIRFNEEILPNGLVKYAEEFSLFSV